MICAFLAHPATQKYLVISKTETLQVGTLSYSLLHQVLIGKAVQSSFKFYFKFYEFMICLFVLGMSMIQGITTSVAETSSTQVQSTTSRSIISEESENPLDVLSRAATMVEKSAEIIGGKVSPAPSSNLNKKHIPVGLQCIDRTSSFKERLHPKFRKSSTPDYLVALEVARSLKRQTNSISSIQSDIQSENMDTMPNNNSLQATHEDLPLDMSIKKRPPTPPALPPPPPYRFKPQTGSPPTHFMYKSPPPYPATPSPPTSLAPLPPPPTYEDSTVKCTYPTKKTPPAPPPPTLLHQEEEKTKIKEITIITSE